MSGLDVPPIIKTAVIGATGNIGRYLWRSYRAAHPDCVGTAFSNRADGLELFDIRHPNLDALRLGETGHRAVLISSAKANIAYCEENREAAYEVNVRGTLELVRQADRRGLKVIFLSTDYVFEGRQGPHDDDAEANPTTEYGRQKRTVETELPSLAKDYLIVRLSKVFGLVKGDGTLLDEIAANFAHGRVIRAAWDQIFCPTFVDDVVRAIHLVQARGLCGTLNLCNRRRWARLDIVRAMAKAMNADESFVEEISLYDIPAMKGRPLDTSMSCARLEAETGLNFTPLEDCIPRVAAHWMDQ